MGGGKGVYGGGVGVKGVSVKGPLLGHGLGIPALAKSKGKGKRPKGPSGPKLPRKRISTEPMTGEVAEWKGKYGWITPTSPIDHPMADKHNGKLYISMSDIVEGDSLTVGSVCQFHIFEDSSGLGAEDCLG